MTDARELHLRSLEARIERDREINERLDELEAKLNEFGDHLEEIDGRLGVLEQVYVQLAGQFTRLAIAR